VVNLTQLPSRRLLRERSQVRVTAARAFVSGNACCFRDTNVVLSELTVLIRAPQVKRRAFFAHENHRQLNAFIADEDMRARDQLADVVFALSTKRAVIDGFRGALNNFPRHRPPVQLTETVAHVSIRFVSAIY
jgi:hypothetical protein